MTLLFVLAPGMRIGFDFVCLFEDGISLGLDVEWCVEVAGISALD